VLTYTYVSVGCPNATPCEPQPCPNFVLCGHKHPLCLLDCWGTLCMPCDMNYAWVFQFFTFPDSQECPVCLVPSPDNSQPTAVKYPCGHMVCAKCYCARVYDRNGDPMQKCPLCRQRGMPLGEPRPHCPANFGGWRQRVPLE
jgi:hypothetical protein